MKTTSKNVMSVTHTCWNEWVKYFEENGCDEFQEPNHNFLLLDAWKENADFIANWVDNVLVDLDFPKRKILTNSFN
ncbi:hypothetical protein IRZ71_23160 [Flavobacterium sp. ANB]|uniref:hypothetical protein n=1 Tax=unclassified Flavobacterium TaxID=196869 RepID=UPI0012B85B6D|nr:MULTISPECIES: hypothetical protein [unclassified Flavobacterium]MBF4519258.1 hypothetical protein [Flavobacterium sp. ANB]MTD71938.1 hypothetical protein [Flavobacterium sp. LC2016-13]